MISPWENLLERPHARGHFVQLYRPGDRSWMRNVGLYLSEGLKRGEGLLIVSTPDHLDSFANHLDQEQIDGGQLVVLDAHRTLASFMVAGHPDWDRFEAAMRGAIRQVQAKKDNNHLRAYGEMVSILWKSRQFAAAIQLEQFWNKLLEQSSFSLYCACSLDILSPEFHGPYIEGVLCTHTHMIPAYPDSELEAALRQALDEVLGADAEAVREQIRQTARPGWAVMPNAEAMVLWLRQHLPEQADTVIRRARQYYERIAA